ncbi:MAG TPA: PEP-CTERM sorting domain-containing protein, partial [Pirellulales bacterium]|nr:PEP-CTERM sorting domain-containing protein [Pirellulales bacterium]
SAAPAMVYATGTIDVAATPTLPVFSMGRLTVASPGGTLNVTASTAPGGEAYGLTFSGATFNGSTTFVIATNTTGGGNAAGTVEITGAPTFSNGVTVDVQLPVGAASGTLRFNVNTGAATVGTGVTAMIDHPATLELAGSVAALASSANRVHVINNSQVAQGGLLVSGTNQVTGGIDGTGNTIVNAGSDLTADHIVQNALIIGGTLTMPAVVTIRASDASGNPLDALETDADGGSLLPNGFTRSESTLARAPTEPILLHDSAADLHENDITGSSDAASTAVPEPPTMLLFLVAAIGGLGTCRSSRRKRRG